MEFDLSLGQLFTQIIDQLALGLDMFGSHAIWISALPLIWILAACLIWINIEESDAEREHRYMAKAEQNLPKLRELTMQRSTEVLEIRPINNDWIK